MSDWDYQQPRWNYHDDQPDSGQSRIVRFQLTAALTRGGSAAAKQLKWDGTAWVVNDREVLTVHDVFARHAAPSGRKGWAIFSPSARRWEILTLAEFVMIRGALKGAMATTDGTWTIDGVSVLQGADPRTDPTSATEEVTIYNLHDWEGDDNASAVAVYNSTLSRWEFLQVTCPA